jgi:hypothetical protein
MDFLRSTGCLNRSLGPGCSALTLPLLLLAILFSSMRAYAQCDTEFIDLAQLDVTGECHAMDVGPQIQMVELNISGTTNIGRIDLAIELEESLPTIDSIQLQWKKPEPLIWPAYTFQWSQGDGGTLLHIVVQWDDCEYVSTNSLELQLHFFGSTNPWEEWHISQVEGGIVQVDVIHSKSFAPCETQLLYNMDGILVRTVDLPIRSAPAIQGLFPGIYLLRRLQGGQVISTKKVLVL